MLIDASNMKMKLVPIVVCLFLPESDVKVKLLQFKSVHGETAEILSEYLLSVLDQTKLKDKLIGFCADNATLTSAVLIEEDIMYSIKLR